MQVLPAIMLGVDIGLGRPADFDLSKWQAMFLPRQLHDFVAGPKRDGRRGRNASTGSSRDACSFSRRERESSPTLRRASGAGRCSAASRWPR